MQQFQVTNRIHHKCNATLQKNAIPSGECVFGFNLGDVWAIAAILAIFLIRLIRVYPW